MASRQITPAIALALEQIGWSDAETWLRLQAAYDLALKHTSGVARAARAGR